ncbi:MAG: hypothetical protein EU544_01860 [Promethearchaeota archaeon]|nr:MAG: hypothetical protein EU544_01860 [Candidatus Lokiarchaeota archaeon]
MTTKNLTSAYIKKNKRGSHLKLDISFPQIEKIQDKSYFLVIQSTSPKCSRVTIYPLKKKQILKLSITGTDISETSIERLSDILKDYEIIHTSGLLIKKKELNFECYLNLNFQDPKSKDLKIALNNLRNIFKLINIEEIGLKRN